MDMGSAKLSTYILDGTPEDVIARYERLADIAKHAKFGELDQNIVVLDTETTGFSFHHDELTQIAAARMENGEITGWFNTFVNPGKPIPDDVQYLTSDIFGKACLGEYSKECTYAKWTELGIDGYIGNEFVKLRDVGLKYNRKTFMEIKEKIAGIHLPAQYCSVQFRGGDKTLEVVRPMDVDCVIDRMKGSGIKIKDCFIFTDDFHYVEDVKRKCPEWNVYTLTKENEHGYVNSAFQRISWSLRRKEMIKLFAMTEICIHSSLHFGCEITCVNDYIKRIKPTTEYKPIWTEEDAGLRKGFINSIKKAYS